MKKMKYSLFLGVRGRELVSKINMLDLDSSIVSN